MLSKASIMYRLSLVASAKWYFQDIQGCFQKPYILSSRCLQEYLRICIYIKCGLCYHYANIFKFWMNIFALEQKNVVIQCIVHLKRLIFWWITLRLNLWNIRLKLKKNVRQVKLLVLNLFLKIEQFRSVFMRFVILSFLMSYL